MHRKYVRTWFLIDFVSSVPYDAIYGQLVKHTAHTEEDLVFFDYLRLLELLKLFRIVRVIRYLTKFLEVRIFFEHGAFWEFHGPENPTL